MGDRRKIDFWNENWGFEGLSGDSICLPRWEVQENRVCERMNEEKDGWNEKRVREIYGDFVGTKTVIFPFSMMARKILVFGSIARLVIIPLSLLIRG